MCAAAEQASTTFWNPNSPKLYWTQRSTTSWSGGTIIATANPGCHMQISQGLARAGKNSVLILSSDREWTDRYRSAGLYPKVQGNGSATN